MRLKSLTIAALALLATGAAEPPATEVEPVTVTASTPPPRERAQAFVNVALKPSAYQSLARWHAPICPYVIGIDRAQGQYIWARIRQVAGLSGAPVAGTPCSPNLIVIVTPEPERLLKLWHKKKKTLYGKAEPPKIERFEATSRPVRAWYNIDLLGGSGVEMTPESGTAGEKSASRLTYEGAVRQFLSVFVVVDYRQMKGVSALQLADYVTLLSLAEVNLAGDYRGSSTILNLFEADGERPQSLSSWDTAMLDALYHTRQDSKYQDAEIAKRIAGER